MEDGLILYLRHLYETFDTPVQIKNTIYTYGNLVPYKTTLATV